MPWTKPDDLSLDMSLPLSGLGSHHQDYFSNGFNVMFADGSVKYLKTSITPRSSRRCLRGTGTTRSRRRVIRATVTEDGRQVV